MRSVSTRQNVDARAKPGHDGRGPDDRPGPGDALPDRRLRVMAGLVPASTSSRAERVDRPPASFRPIDAQLLKPLAGEHRLLCREQARVDALPGDLAGEAAELDLGAAV